MRTIQTSLDRPVMMLDKCQLRLVKIEDYEASPIFAFGSRRSDTLEEWWVVPDNGVCWSQVDLTNACCNDLQDLQQRCLKEHVLYDKISNTIARTHLPLRPAGEFAWNFSVQHVDGIGWVLSVVCASKAAMEELYRRHWREPHSGLAPA